MSLSYVPCILSFRYSCLTGDFVAQFEISVYSESSSKQPVKDLVRSKILPQLRVALANLPKVLVQEHGKDIQHAPGSNPSSGFATPAYHAQKSPSPAAGTPKTATTSTGKVSVNTTTVTASDEFRTTAEELYTTFTDPQRIAAFTRGAPRQFEGAKVGGKFAIFDGNVTGEFVTLEPSKRVVQKWRLAQWPEGHFSTQEIVFDQNDVDRVTVMRVTWTGVPIGQEEVVQRNWEGYYVRSIKQTFGYSPPFSFATTTTTTVPRNAPSPSSTHSNQFSLVTRLLMFFFVLLLGVGLARYSEILKFFQS
jgi:activator of HSP90 ATPase